MVAPDGPLPALYITYKHTPIPVALLLNTHRQYPSPFFGYPPVMPFGYCHKFPSMFRFSSSRSLQSTAICSSTSPTRWQTVELPEGNTNYFPTTMRSKPIIISKVNKCAIESNKQIVFLRNTSNKHK